MVTYHCFVPAAARIMQPLFRVFANKPKELMWDKEATTAFDNANEALAKEIMFVHLRVNAPTALTVHASDTIVGGVPIQFINGN